MQTIDDIQVVSYTTKQEKANVITHLLGLPIALAVLVFSIVILLTKGIEPNAFIGLIIFAFTMAAVYGVSSLYHCTSEYSQKKKIRRVLDHCTIYLLIAGTYTPICVYISSIHYIGIIVLCLEWGLAIISIILNAIDFSKKSVKIISMFMYIALGWMILYSTAFIYLPQIAFIFLLAGGIAYTIGSILYGLGRKVSLWFHPIFHVFILLGTALQTIGVMFLFI